MDPGEGETKAESVDDLRVMFLKNDILDDRYDLKIKLIKIKLEEIGEPS